MIDAYVVGFGRPDLLREQKRLIDKYCREITTIRVIDNTPGDASQMQAACQSLGIDYQRGSSILHNDALNLAARQAHDQGTKYWMTIDHDVFPRRKVTLKKKIDQAGFYGIGQTHPPTRNRYLFPGFACFSAKWLDGRIPNFDGIRGAVKRDDGDCGSMLHTLFTDEDWEKMFRPEHGYGHIRPDDHYGLQSFGYEYWDGWLHFTNASHWMDVPDPVGRDRLLAEMLREL